MQNTAATSWQRRATVVHSAWVMASVIVTAVPGLAHGQGDSAASRPLPFAIGERLNYRVRVGAAGSVGHGSMWIEGPVDVRGTQTMRLRSDFDARVGFLHAFDRSDSWLDPVTMTAMRYAKSEKQPLSSSNERVEIFPAEQRWSSANGQSGASLTHESLDELSFIYYVRTLILAPDSAYSVNRHYDAARNPVTVRVLARETVNTEAGEFATVVVEMRVKDANRFRHEGVIKLFLTDDARHMPVRIESQAPVFGTAVFTLQSFTSGDIAR